MSGFTAPVGGDSNKIDYDQIEKIPVGEHVCTLFSMVHLGTQETKHGMKEQVQLTFEFPTEMRTFWEGDPPKPSAIFCTETFSMYKEAHLRQKYVEGILGNKLSDEEAEKYDLTQLVGKNAVAYVVHSPDGKWANIDRLSPLTEKSMKMFDLTEPRVAQVNPSMIYHISMGFEGEDFKKLPQKLREKIIKSTEAQAHAAKGGTFAKPDTNSGSNGSSASGGRKLQMLPSAPNTYEEFMEAEWTEQMLVDNGYAKWVENTPPPKPAGTPAPPKPSAPVPPSKPSAPAAPQASTPAPPKPEAKSEFPIVMKNKALQANIPQWIKEGWTFTDMVEQGHADWVPGREGEENENDVPY